MLDCGRRPSWLRLERVCQDVRAGVRVDTNSVIEAFKKGIHEIIRVLFYKIVVAGPAGCGKSECVKTFALAERERGKTIDVQTIFTKSVESKELLGYLNPISK